MVQTQDVASILIRLSTNKRLKDFPAGKMYSVLITLFCTMNKFILAALILLPLLIEAQGKITTAQYVAQYNKIAVTEMNKYGIPASVKLGQGILESASGNSDLAQNAKNHFGIKCKKDWVGETYTMDDDEKNECFRKYETVLSSYEDHSQFLKNSARYAELFTYDKADYKSWAIGLKKAGYATNPQYTALLIKTIEENKLSDFDSPGTTPSFQPPKNQNASNGPSIENPPARSKDREDLSDFELKKANQRSVMTRNNVKYVLAKEGETFESIAKEMDLMVWQLPKYNDLPKAAVLKANDVIYIQPKRRKAESLETHTLRPGETMRDISQLNAVKLSRLYDLNGIEEGAAVKAGTVVKLK